jgi:hypothetical protein
LAKPSLTICCVAIAFFVNGGVGAAPLDRQDIIYVAGRPCGFFCQLFGDSAPPPAPEQPSRAPTQTNNQEERSRATIARSRPVVARDKQRNGAASFVPVPRVRPDEARPSQPTQSAAGVPSSNGADKAKAPPTLEALVELAGRLTMDAAARDSATVSDSPSSDVETTGSVPKYDPRVALVIAKSQTLSLPELARKSVAIDGDLSKWDAAIRTALVAAGAPEVQISEDQQHKAIDRLLRDEVPAAILGLVSSDAADSIPEIDGYHIFRTPLSPK